MNNYDCSMQGKLARYLKQHKTHVTFWLKYKLDSGAIWKAISDTILLLLSFNENVFKTFDTVFSSSYCKVRRTLLNFCPARVTIHLNQSTHCKFNYYKNNSRYSTNIGNLFSVNCSVNVHLQLLYVFAIKYHDLFFYNSLRHDAVGVATADNVADNDIVVHLIICNFNALQ